MKSFCFSYIYHPVSVNVCFIRNVLVCSFAGGRWTASWEQLLFVETAPLGAVRPVLDIKSMRNITSMFGTVAVGFRVVIAWLLNSGWLSVGFNQQELQEHHSKVPVCFLMAWHFPWSSCGPSERPRLVSRISVSFHVSQWWGDVFLWVLVH